MSEHHRSDIVATLQFVPTDQGGRGSPIVRPIFGCIFEHGGEANDCGLIINEKGDVWPGQKITLPIFFLRPDLVRPRIKVGDSFVLREDKVIARGTIDEIVFE
jgi:hypothetical protein